MRDPDAGVRGQALAGLALYGDLGALGDVTQALDDPSLGVRLAALGALVRLGRDGIGAQLLALNAGHDRYLALRAAVQLSRTSGAQAALPALREAADDADPAVRVAAMNAAGELGAPATRSPPTTCATPTSTCAWRPRARSSPPAVTTARCRRSSARSETPRRLDAADELARLGDSRGLLCCRPPRTPPTPRERRAALALLAPLPLGYDSVVAALGDSDADVRLDAAGALLRRLFRYDAGASGAPSAP